MARERLQKIIANAGVMSRRAAETAIAAGRVTLNGAPIAEMGTLADPEIDVIEVDGKPLRKPEKRLFLFYKPRSVITSKQDEKGRVTVMDFFKDIPEVNPVGRLDYESEGLLLMTTDGDLHHKMTHPKFEIEKEYWITLSASLGEDELSRLRSGISLEDGIGKFDSIEEKTIDDQNGYLIKIHEGKNRFIRRMLEAVDGEILILKRLRIGRYTIGTIKPGERVEVKIEKSV